MYKQLYADIAEEAAAPLSQKLREHAASKGWPQVEASALSYVVHNGDLQLHIEDNMRDQVTRREYGTATTQANPAIRTFDHMKYLEPYFLNNFSAHIADIVEDL